MAAITLQRLKQIISDAYAAGYGGSLDMSESYVQEITTMLLATPEQPLSKNEGWKIFKHKELRDVPVGTIFEHSSRGKGWIESNSTEKYMRFHNGEICHFYSDESPWDEPMRIIGSTIIPSVPKPKNRWLNNPFHQ